MGGRYVSLVAQYRIDLGRLARVVELDRAVEVAVIGKCQGVHPQLFCLAYQVFDLGCSVEQAVVAVTVEMYERLAAHPEVTRQGQNQ